MAKVTVRISVTVLLGFLRSGYIQNKNGEEEIEITGLSEEAEVKDIRFEYFRDELVLTVEEPKASVDGSELVPVLYHRTLRPTLDVPPFIPITAEREGYLNG